MGTFSLMGNVCFLISWALMLMCSAAESEYFHQPRNLTWDEARNHCQVCFKDLVTLTPENIQTIAMKISSDSWIGLRKNFYSTGNYTSDYTSNYTSNSTSNSTSDPRMSWTRWANGDPLAFQNWYPGWPVFKSPFPRRDCCSCSCTCPAKAMTTTTHLTTFAPTGHENVTDIRGPMFDLENVTDIFGLENMTAETGFENVTGLPHSSFSTSGYSTAAPSLLPLESECVRSPMLLPDVPDPDEKYIEDSCVAMLSFGAWIEKNCGELLPFICYEERFFGQVNVTSITSNSAFLEWLPGPGNISHYRLEVTHNTPVILSDTDFSYSLSNLSAGTHYSVQVFPVKCGRDLNPQENAFYTIPDKVENLRVTSMTETSITLSWKTGNVTFYHITVQELKEIYKIKTGGKEITGLTPGNLYTFSVTSEVNTDSMSEEVNITAYTKPVKVSDLKVSNNTDNSVFLNWVLPKGNASDYLVKVKNDSGGELFYKEVTQTETSVTGLPVGTNLTITVVARANHTLEGDTETVNDYTVPGPVLGLTLNTTDNSLTAIWSPPPLGNSPYFRAVLHGDNENDTQKRNLEKPKTTFINLKTAAYYTVTVYTILGPLKSPPVTKSGFTLPKPPSKPTVVSRGKKNITFAWTAPPNTAVVKYSVKLSSSFWKHTYVALEDSTNHTFTDLMSGTKYDFEVKTVAGNKTSLPVKNSTSTYPEKRVISLSMLCSSTQSLLCDNSTSKTQVLTELKKRFQSLFRENIFWELQEQGSES